MFCVAQQDRDVDDHLVAVEGVADPIGADGAGSLVDELRVFVLRLGIRGMMLWPPTKFRKGVTMLGEHLGTISGPTSMKSIAAVGGMPTFETTASGLVGTLAGSEVTSFATYSATMRADGSFYGECPNAGVIMAADGVATFRATGAGSPTPDGGFVFKGVVYFETQAPSLAMLNGKAVVYDWIVDPEGSATWDLWEWA